MHRIMVHGRQGDAMLAISAIDCALWDLKGRWLGQPVFRLLGGPTRDSVPAYASMLGFAVLDLGRVRERAAEYQALGYPAQKWFFRHGPMSGHDGMRKNVELVRTLRETLGDDYDIMLDCWQSFDPIYAVELAERIAEYRPRWLEECVMPDRIDSYRRVKERTQIPLSGAEHEYTRWGFKRFIDAEALDVLQPDIYWAGGLSETLKIAAYASVHDLMVIPHGHSTPAGLHFSLAQSPMLTPIQEYLVKWNAINQHFLAHPITPRAWRVRACRRCRDSAWTSIRRRSRRRRRFTANNRFNCRSRLVRWPSLLGEGPASTSLARSALQDVDTGLSPGHDVEGQGAETRCFDYIPADPQAQDLPRIDCIEFAVRVIPQRGDPVAACVPAFAGMT